MGWIWNSIQYSRKSIKTVPRGRKKKKIVSGCSRTTACYWLDATEWQLVVFMGRVSIGTMRERERVCHVAHLWAEGNMQSARHADRHVKRKKVPRGTLL